MTVKKVVSFLLALMFIVNLSVGSKTSASESAVKEVVLPQIYVVVNDELVQFPDAQPGLYSDTTFIPVRFYAESMKLNVEYQGETVVIKNDSTSLTLHIHDNFAIKADGTKVPMWMFEKQDRVMTPYRYIAEYFGYKIEYIANGPIARAKDDTAKLSSEQLVEKLKPIFDKNKADYDAYQAYLAEERKKAEEEANRQPVYLTFDDGPNANTPAILDILDSYNGKATFFMLGNNITSHSQTVKRMLNSGNGLGLHSVTHDKDRFYKSPSASLAEMNQANNSLYKAVGVKSSMIRTPYGSKPYFTQKYRDATAGAGYHLWDWNVDSNDWRYPGQPDAIYNNVMNQVKSLKKRGVAPVILFHDQKTTTQVLPKVMEALKKEGYTFKALSSDMTPVNFWYDER